MLLALAIIQSIERIVLERRDRWKNKKICNGELFFHI